MSKKRFTTDDPEFWEMLGNDDSPEYDSDSSDEDTG